MNSKKNKETDTTSELIATNFRLSMLLGVMFLVIVLILPVLNEYARSLTGCLIRCENSWVIWA